MTNIQSMNCWKVPGTFVKPESIPAKPEGIPVNRYRQWWDVKMVLGLFCFAIFHSPIPAVGVEGGKYCGFSIGINSLLHSRNEVRVSLDNCDELSIFNKKASRSLLLREKKMGVAYSVVASSITFCSSIFTTSTRWKSQSLGTARFGA